MTFKTRPRTTTTRRSESFGHALPAAAHALTGREHISEAERMEEGKRMFQIFAARMFEQRVLQAYREKVAKQREEQLLRELEEEDDAKRQKEEKKAKESQKKKDKKR